MDTPTTLPPDGRPARGAAVADVPPVRSCTRCEGEQHLVAADLGFGKFRCLGCGLVVGFDLEASPVEFLLDRGSPGRYSRGRFGSRLLGPELRLP